MPISDSDRQAIAMKCTKFLGYRPGSTFADRMRLIAESEYASQPLDHYGVGGFVTEFEQEIAGLLGKEAAVFMPSGTMAQQIALRIWCDRAASKHVAFHPTCHLEIHEQGAYRELHGLTATLLGEADRLFDLSDLEACPPETAAMLIELPQREIGGQLPSWPELEVIAALARTRSMKLQLDGARLWECQPFYGKSYAEICALFDSVYVSFYKILGGLPGAALAGPADFVAEARIWLRRHGGNLQTMAPAAISAKLGLERQLQRIPEYVSHAQAIAKAIQDIPALKVVPENPPVNMMHWFLTGDKDVIEDALYAYADETGILLFRSLWATGDPSVWKMEVTISERSLDVSPAEVRTGLERILAAS